MRILVASVQVPFVYGGAEILAHGLVEALRSAGHEADLVAIPFNQGDPERIADQMLACALMDLKRISGRAVDRLIALKFPAYLIPHPNKVVWLMHQHRPVYDLWESSLGDLRNAPRGTIVRDIIRRADLKMCSEVKALFTLSENVTRRLREFWNVDSTPLHHPPAKPDAFYCADKVDDYIFYPSRVSPNKRQDLVLRALALTRNPVRIRFAGVPDTASYGDEIIRLASELRVHARVEWLGYVDDEKKRDLYARAVAVIFPPFDEDYGYVTLEAMLASKAVITCADSGGPLEFVRSGETGLIAAPTAEDLAAAMDTLWRDRKLAQTLGRTARREYDARDLSWSNVVTNLLA
jgi:glycosyltransferase involved in cell wall biosynthesis